MSLINWSLTFWTKAPRRPSYTEGAFAGKDAGDEDEFAAAIDGEFVLMFGGIDEWERGAIFPLVAEGHEVRLGQFLENNAAENEEAGPRSNM